MQAKHLTWPDRFWKLPPEQVGQAGAPKPSLAVPSGHGRQASGLLAPVIGWYVPSPQGRQPSLLLRPISLDQVPGWHNSKTEAELAPTSSQ